MAFVAFTTSSVVLLQYLGERGCAKEYYRSEMIEAIGANKLAYFLAVRSNG